LKRVPDGGVGQGDQVRLCRLDERAKDPVSAVVAHGFELDGALHTLVEHL
jgi:hypothetical protein